MPNKTKIQWTDYTSNPLVPVEGGWGCSKVSPGCDHCYAEALNKRLGNGREFRGRWQFELKDRELAALGRLRGSQRVFMCDMTDLFHSDVPWEYIVKIFNTMACLKHLTFQVLTKRPGRMAHFAEHIWPQQGGGWVGRSKELARFPSACPKCASCNLSCTSQWPGTAWPPNVWAGVSVEAQKYAPRLDVLARVPARVRFVSCEPLIGPLDLRPWLTTIHWTIIGGESGPSARPVDVHWVANLMAQCGGAGVPVFVKQLGVRPYRSPEREGATGYCLPMKDRKGGDPREWPESLRVRQMP